MESVVNVLTAGTVTAAWQFALAIFPEVSVAVPLAIVNVTGAPKLFSPFTKFAAIGELVSEESTQTFPLPLMSNRHKQWKEQPRAVFRPTSIVPLAFVPTAVKNISLVLE